MPSDAPPNHESPDPGGSFECEELEPCVVAGQRVRRFCLRNPAGVRVELMAFGATVLAVELEAADGTRTTLTRGLATPECYASNNAYMGAICGRYAGRIANAGFELQGRRVELTRNSGAHHLHGGARGFDSRVWRAEPFLSDDRKGDDRKGVHFEYTSRNGEEGYPGRLSCRVSYSLDAGSRLRIDYAASVHDQPTVVNLTSHCYWNLSDGPDVLGHTLQLTGKSVLEVDEDLIPTGARLPVMGTAFDFSAGEPIGAQLAALPHGSRGFDNCYLLDQGSGQVDGRLAFAARALDPVSGRSMELYTDQPAVVFYTGNFLDGSPGVGGHRRHAGFCLECQQLPDAPNQPDFPSTVLFPGETYTQTSVYQFFAARR